MCGRIVAVSTPKQISEHFSARLPMVELRPNYNVAPTHDVYGIVEGNAESQTPGERLIAPFHWGLIPSWAKEQKIGSRMINARSETADTKASFRAAMKRRRCLLPADGFYEWRRDPNDSKKKQPYFIHSADGEMLAFGGLWERWRGPDKDAEEPLHSCAVLTTSANEFMSQIHDRMPVLLAESDWVEWLDPANEDVASVKHLMRPAPEDWLVAHPVDPKVGNVRNKGAELVDPYDVEAPSEAG